MNQQQWCMSKLEQIEATIKTLNRLLPQGGFGLTNFANLKNSWGDISYVSLLCIFLRFHSDFFLFFYLVLDRRRTFLIAKEGIHRGWGHDERSFIGGGGGEGKEGRKGNGERERGKRERLREGERVRKNLNHPFSVFLIFFIISFMYIYVFFFNFFYFTYKPGEKISPKALFRL